MPCVLCVASEYSYIAAAQSASNLCQSSNAHAYGSLNVCRWATQTHISSIDVVEETRGLDATYCHMPAERNGAVCAPLCATQYSLFVRLRTQRATQRAFIYEIKSGTLADRRGSAGCALPGPTDKAQPQAMCDLTVVRPLSFFTAFFFHESYMHTNRKQMQRSL